MSYPDLIPPLIYVLGYDKCDDDDEWEDDGKIANIRDFPPVRGTNKSPPLQPDRADKILPSPNISLVDKAPSGVTVIKLEQLGNANGRGAKLARIKIKKNLNNRDTPRRSHSTDQVQSSPSRSPYFSPSRLNSTSSDDLDESRFNSSVETTSLVPLLIHSIRGLDPDSDTESEGKIYSIISILNMKSNQLPVAVKEDKKLLRKEPKQLNPISRTHKKPTVRNKDEIVDLDHILTRSFRGDILEPIELGQTNDADKLHSARNSVRKLLGEIIGSCHSDSCQHDQPSSNTSNGQENPSEQYKISVNSTRSNRILKSSRQDPGWIDRRLSSIRDGKPQSILKNPASESFYREDLEQKGPQNSHSASEQEDKELRPESLSSPNAIPPVLSDRRAKVDKIIDTITES